MPNDATADPQHILAELQRKLDASETELAQRTAERDEALDQQTATAEVLQVINSSPGDLAPVFDAILEKAHSLCEAPCGSLQIFDGERLRAVATRGMPEAFTALLRRGFYPSGKRNEVVQGDFMELGRTPDNQVALAAAEIAGLRAMVAVPLQKDGAFLGRIVAARHDIRPFTDRQIALLQNFAAQAVIAIENARLLGELRDRTHDLEESLEYQTATSDVLQVISRSTFDLQPVLDTLVQTAVRLCDAQMGHLAIREDEAYRFVATHSVSPEWDALARNRLFTPSRGTVTGRTLLERRVVHMADCAADPEYAWPEAVTVGKIRTSIGVPLLREGEPLGVLILARQRVEPFTERQIELVRTFADQAVIAMENTRLLTETREALEQQTATAEVLQVINSSPGELAPVFEAIATAAAQLCDAANCAVFRFDGSLIHLTAQYGLTAGQLDTLRATFPLPPGRGSVTARAIMTRRVAHVPDLTADVEFAYPSLVEAGLRGSVSVPMLREGVPIGAITVTRQESRSFSDRQIALLENFAAQAVIAIENARLLTETREALEQQTATAEVLQVINASPGDVQPTFDAIAASATRLCAAASGAVFRFDGAQTHLAAHYNCSPVELEALRATYPCAPSRGSVTGRAILTRAVAYVADIGTDPDYALPRIVQSGMRAHLSVPMLQDGNPVGAITVARREATPFSETQIELLKTFAAQAVIAMENARLIDEIRQRQAELRVTFDNMGDGVVMFDEELRLAAWNRNFQEMLDLSDAVLASRPSYAEYLGILAERGEFGSEDIEGELERRLAETAQELRFERTRPDGRVVEVRRNAVPGGGFVLIYSDITERKEAEARLRAARDTAEGALRELRAAQASLIHAEKMASLGQLTAGIAHEIKNPLNFVNNFAGLSVELLDELKEATGPAVGSLDDDERADIDELVTTLSGNLEKIAEHGRRADGIVTSMLLHSRGGSGERMQVNLNVLVDEALNLAYHGARARDQGFEIELERDFEPAARPIELVPQDITRVLLNLIGNGLYAATTKHRAVQSGKPAVLKVTTRDLGQMVEIRVRDNGGGIPPQIRDKLFQPFFTTKPTGEGTGLGLSISWDIVTQQHGGTIEVNSRVGEFTEFIVRLPRAFVAAPSERSAVAL